MGSLDAITMGAVVGIIIAVVQLGDRLWKKSVPDQSKDCERDHGEIRELLKGMAAAQRDMMSTITLSEKIAAERHAETLRTIERTRV